MNRILVIGCGSIGIRHIRALQFIGENNVYALRTYAGHVKELPSDIKNNVREIFNNREALGLKPTHVIISNPTSLHLKYIKLFINSGAKLFVEKPLSDDYLAFRRLNKEILKKLLGNKGLVGFHLRFNLVFQKLKKLINEGNLGRPLYAHFYIGHYLPYWHLYEDYRKSYAARRDLGGGALRTLSHEIDLVTFFFGQVMAVFAKTGRIGNLEIDVEDCVDIIMKTEKCERVVVHMDYLRPILERRGEITFEKGLIEYDYFTNKIYRSLYKDKKKNIYYQAPKKYNYDSQFQLQMKEFLSKKPSSGCSLKEGVENLRFIHMCEKSHKMRKELCLS